MYKHILVPIDGSEPSRDALRTAISLAKEVGAQIRLVHVVDNSAYLTGFDAAGTAGGDLLVALRDNGFQILMEGVGRIGSSPPADRRYRWSAGRPHSEGCHTVRR